MANIHCLDSLLRTFLPLQKVLLYNAAERTDERNILEQVTDNLVVDNF